MRFPNQTLLRRIVLILAIAFFLSTRVNASELFTQKQVTPPENTAEFLVKTPTGFDANKLTFQQTEYVGQCPGTGISPNVIQGRFVSRTLPPASGRRVLIRNVTPGLNNDPFPYTDRNYSDDQYSEGFDFSLGDRHRRQTFSVIAGVNQFQYEISERKQILERGTLTADVIIKEIGVFPREAICTEQLQCRDESVNCGDDKKGTRQRCYTTSSCNCP